MLNIIDLSKIVLLTFLSNFRPLTSLTTYIEKPCGQRQINREKSPKAFDDKQR